VHPKTAKAIIANDEELNIGELAEAILEDKKREPKRKHIPSQARSQEAYHRIQHRKQDEISWRNAVAKVWDKQKRP
jgi:hypothetical protein